MNRIQQILKYILIAFGMFFIVGVMIFTIRYYLISLDEKDLYELSRITSPDSRIDAIIVVDSVSDDHIVNITVENAGRKLEDIRGYNFCARKMYGCSVRWRSNQCLEIHYSKAMISNFSNIWCPPNYGPMMPIVEILLIKDGGEMLDIIHE